MAIIDYTKCPLCHGKGFRDDGTICEQCKGLGQIPVHDAPDEVAPER
jgi:DnaJ-class molecular chaperone